MSGVVIDMRRGWCPSVLRPMPTGDGLLARLYPRAARLSAAQARAVAAAARACGNGLLDLSNRGNLQIRGVRPETHARLVALLSEAGLDDAFRPRACIVPPLAGPDAVAMADGIEAALADLDDLPPKFAVAVDGGALPLGDVEADVRLAPIDADRLAVALAGPDGFEWISACARGEGPIVLRAVAAAFCAVIRNGDPARRIRDLAPAARARLAADLSLAPALAPPARPSSRPVGTTPLADGTLAVGFGLAFGRLGANLLDRLAEWVERFSAGELRLSPWRSIFLPGIAPEDGQEILALGRDAGLILDDDDPRRAVTACPGAPACASATMPTQADAARLAAQARHLSNGATVHLSGCVKGCARPAPADLTLVGENGRYGVVVRGDARQRPIAYMDMQTILDRLRDIESEGALAALPAERLARAFAEGP